MGGGVTMTNLAGRLRDWSTRVWYAATALVVFRPWLLAGTVSEGDEVPNRIPIRRAFLVGGPSAWKWLVFDCPCRTGHRIMLNLDRSRWPHWTIRPSRRRRITLSPSIDYRSENRSCHYFIRDGRVVWTHRSRCRSRVRLRPHRTRRCPSDRTSKKSLVVAARSIRCVSQTVSCSNRTSN